DPQWNRGQCMRAELLEDVDHVREALEYRLTCFQKEGAACANALSGRARSVKGNASLGLIQTIENRNVTHDKAVIRRGRLTQQKKPRLRTGAHDPFGHYYFSHRLRCISLGQCGREGLKEHRS